MENLEFLVAKKLLQLKTFRLQLHNPFTWANGWKAPIYFDDRKIFSYPYMRNFIKLELARTVAERYPDADAIAGVAVNAIGHGVLVAEQLDLPFVSVYPKPKNHGLENRIEGDLRPRQKVVIIENQITSGDFVMKVIEAVRDYGCTVLGVVSIFDFELPGVAKRFRDVDVEMIPLTHYGAVAELVRESNRLTAEDISNLHAWHESPKKWKK